MMGSIKAYLFGLAALVLVAGAWYVHSVIAENTTLNKAIGEKNQQIMTLNANLTAKDEVIQRMEEAKVIDRKIIQQSQADTAVLTKKITLLKSASDIKIAKLKEGFSAQLATAGNDPGKQAMVVNDYITSILAELNGDMTKIYCLDQKEDPLCAKP